MKIKYPPIKLTPRGNRFADVVKRELADSDSELSKITRHFRAYKIIVANNKYFEFILCKLGNYISYIAVKKKVGRFHVVEPISNTLSDMTLLFNRDTRKTK